MANNVAGSSGTLTRRQYYAAHGRFGNTPTWFKHAQTSGKPSAPSTAALTADELTVFNAWNATRLNGTVTSQTQLQVDALPNVGAVVAAYETYYAAPKFTAWAHDDLISREHQWRLRNADILEALETGATVPISADPSGAGQNAPVSPIMATASPSPTASTFDSSSSTNVPSGATQAVVELWGAGGSGKCGNTALKGGGAGGYVKKTIAVAPADYGATISFTVGVGGASVSTSSNGNAGGNTTSTVTLTAGVSTLAAGGGANGGTGTGGTASGGDINTVGGAGTSVNGGNAPYGGTGGGEGVAGIAPGAGGGWGSLVDVEASGGGANGRAKFTWNY